MNPDHRPTQGAGGTALVVISAALGLAAIGVVVVVVLLTRSNETALEQQPADTAPVTPSAVSQEKMAEYEDAIAREFLRAGVGVEDYQAAVDSLRSSLPTDHPYLDRTDPSLVLMGLRVCRMLDGGNTTGERRALESREDDSAVASIVFGAALLHLCPEHALADGTTR